MDETGWRDRLRLLLETCQEANAAADPRPLLGLIAREVAALAALLEPPRIVGESRQIRGVREIVENIRASAAAVLLTGEPGTGKGLAAFTIHHTSLRSRGPFVVVRCAEAPAGLADVFRRARGGSLYLREVCDLTPAAQGEILRWLEDAETDIRLLSSSARDLEAESARGALRRELYYRLKVIHIAMPPLREIVEDIPLLAEYFFRRSCAEFRREATDFARGPDLAGWSWPGNAAQLEAEIRLRVRGTLKQTVERLERQMLEEALEASHDNQLQAAKVLGLSRQGLINKMKRYGL